MMSKQRIKPWSRLSASQNTSLDLLIRSALLSTSNQVPRVSAPWSAACSSSALPARCWWCWPAPKTFLKHAPLKTPSRHKKNKNCLKLYKRFLKNYRVSRCRPMRRSWVGFPCVMLMRVSNVQFAKVQELGSCASVHGEHLATSPSSNAFRESRTTATIGMTQCCMRTNSVFSNLAVLDM